jgi:hypothetical protein
MFPLNSCNTSVIIYGHGQNIWSGGLTVLLIFSCLYHSCCLHGGRRKEQLWSVWFQTRLFLCIPIPEHQKWEYSGFVEWRHFSAKHICHKYILIFESWDSAVGIVTGCGLDDQGVRVQVPVEARIFTSPCHPDRLWGPFSLLSNGYWGALSPGVKRLGRKADNSPPTSAEVKETWVYTSTPSYIFMV